MASFLTFSVIAKSYIHLYKHNGYFSNTTLAYCQFLVKKWSVANNKPVSFEPGSGLRVCFNVNIYSCIVIAWTTLMYHKDHLLLPLELRNPMRETPVSVVDIAARPVGGLNNRVKKYTILD